MRVIEDSKSLIRQLSNVELVELERERECCGFGGTFAVKHPAISGAMVDDKVDDILATGAPRVIAGDCGCLLNITGAIDHRKLPVSASTWRSSSGRGSMTRPESFEQSAERALADDQLRKNFAFAMGSFIMKRKPSSAMRLKPSNYARAARPSSSAP